MTKDMPSSSPNTSLMNGTRGTSWKLTRTGLAREILAQAVRDALRHRPLDDDPRGAGGSQPVGAGSSEGGAGAASASAAAATGRPLRRPDRFREADRTRSVEHAPSEPRDQEDDRRGGRRGALISKPKPAAAPERRRRPPHARPLRPRGRFRPRGCVRMGGNNVSTSSGRSLALEGQAVVGDGHQGAAVRQGLAGRDAGDARLPAIRGAPRARPPVSMRPTKPILREDRIEAMAPPAGAAPPLAFSSTKTRPSAGS